MRGAGVNLTEAYTMIDNMMAGRRAVHDRRTSNILEEHFPNYVMGGMHPDAPVAIALRQALAQFAPVERPITRPSSSGTSNRRSVFGRVMEAVRPRPAAAPDVPAAPAGNRANPPAPTPAARTRADSPSDAAVRRLYRRDIDMGRLQGALANNMTYGVPLPADLQHALHRVGVDTHVETGMSLVNHPLLNLSRAVHRHLRPLTSARATAAPSQGNRTRPLPVMPERRDSDSDASYAWHLFTLNPGASVEDVAAAAVPRERGRAAVASIRRFIADAENISSKFGQLRTISTADAEQMGFKDAATHPDDPTECLFGEGLSLSDRSQQVIGLAPVATGPGHPYNEGDNKQLVFMDMRKLAQYLIGKPEHPETRAPLTAENINRYAFKIGG